MSEKALRDVVLTYAAVIGKAVAGGVTGWEKRVKWFELNKKMRLAAKIPLGEIERAAGAKARAQVKRAVHKAGTDPLFGEAASNPYAVSWAETRSSAFITNLDDSMRAAVRSFIADATRVGAPPKSLARQLESIVGLREDQTDAITVMRDALAAEGRAPDEIDRLVQARGARMLRQRADMIARTEITAAQSAGNMNEIAQMQSEGLIPDGSVRDWMDADGCPICVDLATRTAPLNRPWHSDILGKDVWAPPAHPNCRCTSSVVVP